MYICPSKHVYIDVKKYYEDGMELCKSIFSIFNLTNWKKFRTLVTYIIYK